MRWNENEGKDAGSIEVRREDRAHGRLVSGLVLMTVGTIFLLGRLDVMPAHALSTYWPLIMVAVGLGRLLLPSDGSCVGEAGWLIFIGLWAQATVLHWFGLTWHNSWPIVLIFIGLRVLVTEVIGRGGAAMPIDRPILTPRLIVGLFILALGTLFLLDNLKLAEARHIVPYLWPAGFIALGITTVLRRWGGRGWAWGLVWIVAGVWLLGDQLGIVHFNFWELFWPLMLLLVGASFVWRAIAGPSPGSSSCGSNRETNSDDVVHLFAMMAGNERRNSSTAFRGGDVSAFMGGCALDLRQAQLADGEAVIDLFAFWGGIELKVPEDWEVVSKVTVLMGGVEDKTKPRVGAARGRLVLRGLALMGGIEIGN